MNKKILFLVLFTILFTSTVFANNVDSVKFTVNLLNQDPDPAVPGQYLELRFNVYKSGNNPAENVEFFLDLKHPFYFDSSDTPQRTLPIWMGQSGNDWYYTLYYKILVDDSALKGNYDIELKYRYNNLNLWTVQKFNIRVDEKKEPNFVFGNLITSPRKILSGQNEVKLDIELQNIGKGNAENVILEFELPEGFSSTYAFSNRINLGSINSSQSKTGTIYLDIDKDVKSDNHKAKVIVYYKDKNDTKNNEIKTKTLYLDIPVKGKPYFKIISQEVLSTDKNIYPGDKINLKIVVKNIGEKDAKSVSLRVLKDSSHPFDITEKSDFIGNLDISEEGEAIISLEVDPTAASKKYKMNVEIRSISENTVFIDDDSIIIDISKMEKDTNKYLLPIGIIILLIVIIGIYVFIKKNKIQRK